MNNNVNKTRRNVVIIGASDIDKENNNFINYSVNSRFPHYIYIDKVEDVKRLEGFIVILFVDNVEDCYEFDRLNRGKFKNFDYILVYTKNFNRFKMANIQINCKFGENISEVVEKLYKKSLTKKDKFLSPTKKKNIERLKKFVKDKDFVTNRIVREGLGVSRRWVDRYMEEMNYIYHNNGKIEGYPNKWYIIK